VKKSLKYGFLRAAELAGLFECTLSTAWRRNRLAILCFHGISLEDEHVWRPSLYISQDTFRSRLEALQRSRCKILPLAEGLRRLYDQSLPPRAVVITFDDGSHTFYRRAYPLLVQYGYPATVYLTTYYCTHQYPVFDSVVSYMLWKRSSYCLNFAKLSSVLDGVKPQSVSQAQSAIINIANQRQLNGEEKHELAADIAGRIGFDYDTLMQQRLCRVMAPEEVSEIAHRQISIELHTHRHRTPVDEKLFVREIDQNRSIIFDLTSQRPCHYCYPNGEYRDEMESWLKRLNISSAVRGGPALARCTSACYHLPRILDGQQLLAVEFRSWVSGCRAFLPHTKIG
jgi:peptidoglycan/xylan/chitin deacetylase (PgdA/CDA1 family)